MNSYIPRRSNVVMVEIIQVIHVQSVIGKGTDEGDPVRKVHEYYTMEGQLLARVDTLGDFRGLPLSMVEGKSVKE